MVYRRSFAEMPAWPADRDEALEMGVHFLLLTQPRGYDERSERPADRHSRSPEPCSASRTRRDGAGR